MNPPTPGAAPQMAAKHTPTPWDDCSKYPELASVRIFAKTQYIGTIGNSDFTKEQNEANAAFIVHCVNTHAQLTATCADVLAALEDLLAEFGEPVHMHHRRKYGEYQICPDVIDEARAALAKAKAGAQ